jgi:hypothetical protein
MYRACMPWMQCVQRGFVRIYAQAPLTPVMGLGFICARGGMRLAWAMGENSAIRQHDAGERYRRAYNPFRLGGQKCAYTRVDEGNALSRLHASGQISDCGPLRLVRSGSWPAIFRRISL